MSKNLVPGNDGQVVREDGILVPIGILLPHLCQSDMTDQAIAATTSAQVITFDTDVHHKFITRTSSSRFTITKTGSYLITFSAVVAGTTGKRLEIWFRKNGTDIVGSNTPYDFKGLSANAVITVNFIEFFTTSEYFELWMWGNDVACKLDYTVAQAANPGVTPARPAVPSIILTANFVSSD